MNWGVLAHHPLFVRLDRIALIALGVSAALNESTGLKYLRRRDDAASSGRLRYSPE